MDLKKLNELTGKQKIAVLLVAVCKAFGLVFSILTVHLVAHLLLEVFSGEDVETVPAVLKILATVAVRVLLIKIGSDAQEHLERSAALVFPYQFFALAAPVILFIAIFEISPAISCVLLIAALLFFIVSWVLYKRPGGQERVSMSRYVADLAVCFGSAAGIVLALAGMAKGRMDVAGAFIVLLHAADFFRPIRQLFLILYENEENEQDREIEICSANADALIPDERKKGLILNTAFNTLGWAGHILVSLFGCIGMICASAGGSVGICIALIFAAAALYACAHYIEDYRNVDQSVKTVHKKSALNMRVFTSAFICIILVPVVAAIHPMLGVQLLVSYCILGFCSLYFGRMPKFGEGTSEALTEGAALLLDTLMLVSALHMQTKGAVSSGGMLIAVVALVCSAGPFLAIGEREEAVYEEEAENSDSF